jgi:hypothetical protein
MTNNYVYSIACEIKLFLLYKYNYEGKIEYIQERFKEKDQ